MRASRRLVCSSPPLLGALLATLLVTLLGACSDGGAVGGQDASMDSARDVAAGEGASAEDTRQEGPDAVMVDALVTDGASADLASWDTGGRPHGQCLDDGDCYWGLPCDVSPPGGQCTECAVPSDCGDTFAFDCVEGLCKRVCAHDGHCPLAHVCAESKLCEVSSCGAVALCQEPYVCGEGGHCERPACGDEGACPAAMFCGDAGLCLENYR